MGDLNRTLNHYEVESVTSKRYSIGEILAAMQPEDPEEVKRIGPPLDYSFKEMRKISDLVRTSPRDGAHAYVVIPVAMPDQPPPASTTPRGEKKKDAPSEEAPKQHVKYCSNAIRLGNNSISSLDGISTALQAVIDMPETLEWIDISFNDLHNISEALLQYKNLKVLYLHANYIDDIHQVDKLASLPHLKILTLHGNFIDSSKGYRQYVISKIPQVQYLDFSRVTRADRDKAGTWVKLKIIGKNQNKKKKIKDIN